MNLDIKKVTYNELKNVPVLENGEPLVPVDKFDDSIVFAYEGFEKPVGMSDQIMVRETIAGKLFRLNQRLKDQNDSLVLKVVYGYRPLSIQAKYFEQVKNKLIESGRIFKNDLDLYEEVHKFIAVPQTAGHPAGAAVDLTIFDKNLGKNLDMGSLIDDFDDEEKMSWFANDLSEQQLKNRESLLSLMLLEGFAPFWGEWWHYSFGDREWAVYYSKNKAVFGVVNDQ